MIYYFHFRIPMVPRWHFKFQKQKYKHAQDFLTAKVQPFVLSDPEHEPLLKGIRIGFLAQIKVHLVQLLSHILKHNCY